LRKFQERELRYPDGRTMARGGEHAKRFARHVVSGLVPISVLHYTRTRQRAVAGSGARAARVHPRTTTERTSMPRRSIVPIAAPPPMLSASAQTSESCDGACLEGWVDRYLVAMRDGDVDPALFARGVKFTENGVRLPLGNEGLWYAMSGIGSYEF